MFGYMRLVYRRLILRSKADKVFWAEGDVSRVRVRMIMEVTISLAVLATSLWALASASITGESEKYFAGLLGTILGYWLRPPEAASS